jgi:hypothetical protein
MNSLLLADNFRRTTKIISSYIIIAKHQAAALSAKMQNDFNSSVSSTSVLKPTFYAAACGVTAKMDKISNMGKAVGPWAPSGIGNGAYNKIIANVRKCGRIFSQKQSSSGKLEYS